MLPASPAAMSPSGRLELPVSGPRQPNLAGAARGAAQNGSRIAWKTQIRLCARYRRLTAAGKKRPLVIAAIAREMAAFLWAIAQHVAPAA